MPTLCVNGQLKSMHYFQALMQRSTLTLGVNESYLIFAAILHIPKGIGQNVYSRTIEILHRAHIFKANCYLKVHNAHFKFASPISG